MEKLQPLDWDELKEAPERQVLLAMPEYQRLTPKQKLFIDAYCNRNGSPDGNYNAVSATMVAYQCKNQNVARVMSYGLMQNPRIMEVLNRFFKRTPPEEFIISLDRALHNKRVTNAQVKILKMKCAVLGLANRFSRLHATPDSESEIAPELKKAVRRKKRKAKNIKPADKPLYEGMKNRF